MYFLIKIVLLPTVIGTFLVHNGIIFLTHRDQHLRAKKLAVSLTRYCRLMCKIFRINIETDFKEGDTTNCLILSNHMSYVDIICLSSLYPTLYVTSNEIKETPILGHICQVAGCLFTERRRKKRDQSTLNNEIKAMAKYLHSGVSITLFPEGTSTDGSAILPFKTSLIQSSMGSDTSIVPMAIRYSNRDKICWYGDMTFFPHFIKLLMVSEINVRIMKAQRIAPSDSDNRKDVGVQARQLISDLYFDRG